MSKETNLNVSFDSLVNSEEVNNEIVSDLNSLFGNNVKNLSNVSQHVQFLLAQKSELEKNLQCATNEAPDRIATALKKAKEVLLQSQHLQDEVCVIKTELTNLRKRSESLLGNISQEIKVIREAESAKVYLKWISDIGEINNAMPELVANHRDMSALCQYQDLKSSEEMLSTSKCLNLKNYLKKCIQYWHKILLDKVTEDFQSTMKAVKWPFLQEDTKGDKMSDEVRKKLDCDLKYLAYLSEANEECDDDSVPAVVKTFRVSCLPIKLLLRPLEVRFFYHFTGKKATNSKENPQWYLTQILRWATLHQSFIDEEFQPILRKHCQVDSQTEFFTGLIRLAAIKLASDLSEIVSEDELLSATVQEALNFDQEIRSLGRIGDASIVRVLTQPDIFQKWRSLEEKFAHELLDEFVSSADAFAANDEQGVCRCAEQLLILLQGITNRCKQLPQPGHRIQFFELQLEILDNYRVRILQLSKSQLSDPFASNYCIFLNTVHYIACTLREWDDIPLFIELHYFRKRFVNLETKMRSSFVEPDVKTDSDDASLSKYIMDITAQENTFRQETLASFNIIESSQPHAKPPDQEGSAFAEVIDLYDHIESEMLSVLGNFILTEFRARSQTYRRQKWFGQNFSTISESRPVDISPSFCPMMEVLVKYIASLKSSLSADIFCTVWQQVAESLDNYIYEEVILDTNFTSVGSLQMDYDITKGFLPIFSDYTRKPRNSFPMITEALILLTIPTPIALLLRDTLNLSRNTGQFPSFSISPVKALEERSIFNLTIKDAERVLKIRTDLFSL